MIIRTILSWSINVNLPEGSHDTCSFSFLVHKQSVPQYKFDCIPLKVVQNEGLWWEPFEWKIPNTHYMTPWQPRQEIPLLNISIHMIHIREMYSMKQTWLWKSALLKLGGVWTRPCWVELLCKETSSINGITNFWIAFPYLVTRALFCKTVGT